MPLFVYVQSVNGPIPQIWYEEQTNGEGKPKRFLQAHKISKAECNLSMDSLMETYPYETAPD